MPLFQVDWKLKIHNFVFLLTRKDEFWLNYIIKQVAQKVTFLWSLKKCSAFKLRCTSFRLNGPNKITLTVFRDEWCSKYLFSFHPPKCSCKSGFFFSPVLYFLAIVEFGSGLLRVFSIFLFLCFYSPLCLWELVTETFLGFNGLTSMLALLNCFSMLLENNVLSLQMTEESCNI